MKILIMAKKMTTSKTTILNLIYPLKKINPETIIRWRYTTDEHGNTIRESNAKFVRWSNGTIQLYIAGGTEILDVDIKSTKQDHMQLFSMQSGIILCNGKLDNRMFFAPSSIRSLAHQKLTMALQGQAKSKGRRKVKFVGQVANDEEKERDRRESGRKLKEQQRKRRSKLGLEEEEKNYGTDESEGEEAKRGVKRGRPDESKILAAQRKGGEDVRREKRRRTSDSDKSGDKDDFINDDDEDDDRSVSEAEEEDVDADD
eukprot:TRINITY_DN3210_c0_g1_i3.p1 TRINITY_DN3210_c0_g1~~TRINITY_DN3210_c0_g1_i3.p1  ORF type:complete len:258 (-),score=95.10 TRINITY_DN3210_c0_g1_i3:81-854(-)